MESMLRLPFRGCLSKAALLSFWGKSASLKSELSLLSNRSRHCSAGRSFKLFSHWVLSLFITINMELIFKSYWLKGVSNAWLDLSTYLCLSPFLEEGGCLLGPKKTL